MKLIKNETEYRDALIELDNLMIIEPDLDTPEGDRLGLLALLIEDYESARYEAEMPDPIEAILFRMDQMSLKQRDLIPYMGSPRMVSEVLARKRPLTLAMIRRLEKGLGIPAKVLIQETRAGSEKIAA